jgi:hypothetical protein
MAAALDSLQASQGIEQRRDAEESTDEESELGEGGTDDEEEEEEEKIQYGLFLYVLYSFSFFPSRICP